MLNRLLLKGKIGVLGVKVEVVVLVDLLGKILVIVLVMVLLFEFVLLLMFGEFMFLLGKFGFINLLVIGLKGIKFGKVFNIVVVVKVFDDIEEFEEDIVVVDDVVVVDDDVVIDVDVVVLLDEKDDEEEDEVVEDFFVDDVLELDEVVDVILIMIFKYVFVVLNI